MNRKTPMPETAPVRSATDYVESVMDRVDAVAEQILAQAEQEAQQYVETVKVATSEEAARHASMLSEVSKKLVEQVELLHSRALTIQSQLEELSSNNWDPNSGFAGGGEGIQADKAEDSRHPSISVPTVSSPERSERVAAQSPPPSPEVSDGAIQLVRRMSMAGRSHSVIRRQLEALGFETPDEVIHAALTNDTR